MGRSPSSLACDREAPLKKGPWAPEEDRLLADHIYRHGHGCWRDIPKLAGLNRCHKSCRLRWINYLRPDINLGPFTNDEEKTIIRLHSMHGNKWSSIAAHLPGRTDNFIKNYWNTNLHKKLLHKGIDPVMHSPPTEISLLTGLAGDPAVAAGNSLSSLSMAPSASNMDASQPHANVVSFVEGGSDMNTLRFKDEATSFTGSYSNMKPPRIKGEATSFTGSYSDTKHPRIKDEASSFTSSYSDMKPPRIKDEASSFTSSYSDMKPPRIKDEASSFTSSYSDMKPPRIKDEASSFTGSYSDMKPPRIKDEAASFTGSYSGVGTGWDMNALSMLEANAAKFQLLQGHCWVTSASLGAMRALVGKLDMLLLDDSSPKIFSSKRVMNGMGLLKDDVEEISSYLDELSEVDDCPPIAMCWMNEARDLSYDMEDYIDNLLSVPHDHFNENKKKKKKKMMTIKKRLKWYKQITYLTQVSDHGVKTSKRVHVSVVPRLPNKPKITEIISDFRIYVQEAIQRHDRYKLHCCSNLRRRTFLSTGVPMHYEETNDHVVIDGRMNEFIDSLVPDIVADQQQLKVVSVLGSGCLGKTTLAKVLYNRIGMQFDCRAFIRVTKKPDMNILFCDLFSQLHQKKRLLPASCNELGISDINISKHLQDKRYLIIIDDLWDASAWDIIKYAFPNGNRGSRIIVTTQIEDVALTCCSDQSEHVFEMKPLDDDHSRKLFFNRLFGSGSDCPEEFKQVSNEIVDICGGLPLATINIASHLANQQTSVSLDFLTYIRDSMRSHSWSSSTSERTRQVLNLSYKDLPHHLKTCLLYLHMYPEGSIVWKDDLVKQWVAEAFIGTRKGKEKDQNWMEEAAGIYFDELIDRRFIQPLNTNYNNNVLSCTVHDVVRDLIAHKSAEENFVVVVDYNRKNISLSHKARRLSLLFANARYAKTPVNIIKPQVRSLIFFGLLECLPSIGEFKLLRVLNLHLSGHWDDRYPIDLTGISELFQLRYLKIASDVCIQLPHCMRGLQCLQTLDVKDAIRVTAIPWDIIYLRHLLHLTLPVETNLLDWIGSSMTDSVISLWSLGKLNYLQDLHLTWSSLTYPSYHLERSMEALGSLIGGHGNLKTIVVAHGSLVKNIVVRGSPKVTISWDRMAPPPLLQRFECSHSRIIFYRIPKWVTELGNLCILKIAVKGLQMICVSILRGLRALTALSLYVETAPLEQIIFDKAGFSVLKHFKLRFMSGITWLKFEANTMPNLWNLKLVFNAIPQMDQHIFISSNQSPFEPYPHVTALISIEHMPGLKEISAKFGGAASDLEYALRTAVSNHPSNPTINVQYSSYADERRKHKQDDERIFSWSLESSSRLHVPEENIKMKELLIACATAVEGDKEDNSSINRMVAELRKMVSVIGDPRQRLGAYMLEALIARIFSSGHSVCKALECSAEPAAPNHTTDFISYRYYLLESCLYFTLGYMSANGAIAEAMKGEDRIHIIDFCISDGRQWVTLLQALAARSSGAPTVRITGIDDSVPAYERGSSNLELVGSRLSDIARACKLPFEFHGVAISTSQLEAGHLGVIPGEIVAVNFALGLHKISDDDGSSLSQRNRILRLVKSLSPRVVTLVEQELNTNDATTFAQRFSETHDYYTAIFDSIDVAFPRDCKGRIDMEQHCLGKEIVNLIACEGTERVERYELFGQWKARLVKAGFTPARLSSQVNDTIKTLLESYRSFYRLEQRDGVLYLGWKDRALVVVSAWH